MSTITKDFNGLPIVFREDGYINMTKALKAFPGKRLDNFFRTDETVEYMATLAHYLNLLPSDSREHGSTANIVKSALLGVGYCGAYNLKKIHREEIRKALTATQQGSRNGTFCHPKLAVFFARWLDVRFAVWCDLMIDNILHGNIQTVVAVPTEEALKVQAVAEALKARVLELEGEVQRLQEGLLKPGEVPRGWLTAWTHLEDQGHGYPFIKAAVKDFGMLCASACKRLVDEQGDGFSPVSRKGKQGNRESDYTYYHPTILKDAYSRLLKMYEMAI